MPSNKETPNNTKLKTQDAENLDPSSQSSSSQSSKKRNSTSVKKNSQDLERIALATAERESKNKKRLDRLMPLIDDLGEQAFQMLFLDKAEKIDISKASEELSRIADQLLDQSEIEKFKATPQYLKMYLAEKELKNFSEADKEDSDSYVNTTPQVRKLVLVNQSAMPLTITQEQLQNQLTELRQEKPSTEEQLLQFKIRNRPDLITLHQAIQRSQWLNIAFDEAPAKREVGAERRRLYADICKQEADNKRKADTKRKFDLGRTYEDNQALQKIRFDEETKIKKKLDDLKLIDPIERTNLVATIRTLTDQAMSEESKKDRDYEAERRKRIEARRNELLGKVNGDRSKALVFERSQAVVEFIRSNEITGDGNQIPRRDAAKLRLRNLNAAIENEFFDNSVFPSDPAASMKDFSEEMSDPLLTPIFQAYATTKWLELRYKSTGPVTRDANFKKMEALISDAPFSDRGNLDQGEQAELDALKTDFTARTGRAFNASMLQACESGQIPDDVRKKMLQPMTSLALVTFRLEAKKIANQKKVALQKLEKEEFDAANVRLEQEMNEALQASTNSLKIVGGQLLALKNNFKQDLDSRQGLFPQNTVEGMLRALNEKIEKDDKLLSPGSSPRGGEETISQTFLTSFLTQGLNHQQKIDKLQEIKYELDKTQLLLQEQIDSLKQRETALEKAVTNLKKVHAKLVTLKKPPYNKEESDRKNAINQKPSSEDEDLIQVFKNINLDKILEQDSKHLNEKNLSLETLDAKKLRNIADKADEIEASINEQIALIVEARELELKKQSDIALEKLNQVRKNLETLKEEPTVLDSAQIMNLYPPFTKDGESEFGDLLEIVNSQHTTQQAFDENKQKFLGDELDKIKAKDANQLKPYESQIEFLKNFQNKSDALAKILEHEINRLRDLRQAELKNLMDKAGDAMVPIHAAKKDLEELRVNNPNLLDQLPESRFHSERAVVLFYKEVALGECAKDKAIEILTQAINAKLTLQQSDLLKHVVPEAEAAVKILGDELKKARSEDLKDKAQAARDALKDVRKKLIELKNSHQIIELGARSKLMAPKLAGDDADLEPIFGEINQLDKAKADQDWEKLLNDAVEADLNSTELTDPKDQHKRKSDFLEKLEAKAKEVKVDLDAAINSKLTEQQVARRKELEGLRVGLLDDFDKIREKLKTLKNSYQEPVAQRGLLYSDLELNSQTLELILSNINGNVGEPNAEVADVEDKAADILDNKIEVEKWKLSTEVEQVQHNSAVTWIRNTKAKTAIFDKALQDEIDRQKKFFLQQERERERQREEERENLLREQMLQQGRERALQIEVASSSQESIKALVRVHERLDRLKKDPYQKSLEKREGLFPASLSEKGSNVELIFKNINQAVEDGNTEDVDQLASRYLNSAIQSDIMQGINFSEDLLEEYHKRMDFLKNGANYCNEVKTKAIEIEGLLKEAELEELKAIAAASLVPLDSAKKELAVLEVENVDGLLESLPTDGSNAVNDVATNQVKEFYRDCNLTEKSADVNAAAKASVEAALNKLKFDATFEEKQSFLEAIPEIVAEAINVLRKSAKEREMEDLIDAAANSLVLIHTAKVKLAVLSDVDLTLLDGLKNPDSAILENVPALEGVKNFYKSATIDGQDEKNQAHKSILQDQKMQNIDGLVNSDEAFEEVKKFLRAIPPIVKLAAKSLEIAANRKEMSAKMTAELLNKAILYVLANNAAENLARIRAAKKDLKNQGGDWLEGLVRVGDETQEAVELVKKFYKDALFNQSQQLQAKKMLQGKVIDNQDLTPEKKEKILQEVVGVAERANSILNRAKEVEELSDLGDAAVQSLIPIHELKRGLALIEADNSDLLKDLQGDDPLAFEMVCQFYKNLDVGEDAKNQSERSLEEFFQQKLHNSDFETQKKFLGDVPAIAKKAEEILRNALQKSEEYVKAENLELEEAFEAMNKVRDKLTILKDTHAMDSSKRRGLLQRNFSDEDDKALQDLFYGLSDGVDNSSEFTAETIKLAIPLSDEEVTQENKHNLAIKFLGALKRKTAEIEKNLQQEIQPKEDLKTQERDAQETKILAEQEGASRGGGPMSKVDFIYPSFTRIIQSSVTERDKIFYPPVEGVTYNRCRPVLHGVTQEQQERIGDKFDFVTTKRPEDLSKADDVKSEINSLMQRANQTLNVEKHYGCLTQQEMAIAILLAIKHGGIMSGNTDRDAVINDLKKVNNLAEDENGQTDAVKLYLRMALFAENFQKLAAKEGFLTGNSYESKYAAKHNQEVQKGLRLKRLPPNYSRDLFLKGGGEIDKWEGICGKIDLTVDVLSRPVSSVSEVGSVSRPLSASNSLTSSKGGSQF